MLQKLDELTTPTLNFPSKLLEYVIQASSGELTINGKTTPVWPMSSASDGSGIEWELQREKKFKITDLSRRPLQISCDTMRQFSYCRSPGTAFLF
jgi:hypothetical protein